MRLWRWMELCFARRDVARRMRKLAAEEIADALPESGLPVVKLLQPGALVDLLFAEKACLRSERVQFAEVLHELHGIVDAIDAKLQRVDVVGIEMDLRLLAGSEGFAGAQIERNGVALRRSGGERPAKSRARSETARSLIERPREECSNDTPRGSCCFRESAASAYPDDAAGRRGPRAGLRRARADGAGVVDGPIVAPVRSGSWSETASSVPVGGRRAGRPGAQHGRPG